ncbi:hypothetical protein Dsin_006044 [Dipteronia sinensis]|uniref:RNase H type-1 domain-containing protein n=1 Tax=Dipteronia sinensis TaxID=43782 RepID=A0AAE0AYX4_9ROSI|nr:hypothetical protein Dsin_006044 [Dipteronia sinensis]
MMRIGMRQFKTYGRGSAAPVYVTLLNIKEYCIKPTNAKQTKKEVDWVPHSLDGLKFNVDGSARGKPGPTGMCGVLRDANGKILCIFSLNINTQDSNKAEVLAIHKACELYASKPSLVGKNIMIANDSMVTAS